jgi:menaquinone-dependent protoporphyrinogen IX oxidase
MKGLIVFKGRYGATAQYADWLGNILKLPVYDSDEVSNSRLNEFDYVIAGTSVYVGKMLLSKWINTHEKFLKGKRMFLFVVCATPSSEVTELGNLLKKNISSELLKSIKVFFLHGRMKKSSLSLVDRLILHMGAMLQKNKSEKERMLTDFDDVRQENLHEILNAVKTDSLVAIG